VQNGIPIAREVYWVGVNDRLTPLFEAKFTATPGQLEQCHALGRAMAERVRREDQ